MSQVHLTQVKFINKWLKFPQIHQERDYTKQRFYEKFQIPYVVGVTDGTHVAIIRPTERDSAYAQRLFLMTPILHVQGGSPEEHYAKLQFEEHNTVERTIGVLKSTWKYLLSRRVLHYHPDTAAKIVNAFYVSTHNICNKAYLSQINREDTIPPTPVVDDSNQEANSKEFPVLARSNETRIHLVHELWAARHF